MGLFSKLFGERVGNNSDYMLFNETNDKLNTLKSNIRRNFGSSYDDRIKSLIDSFSNTFENLSNKKDRKMSNVYKQVLSEMNATIDKLESVPNVGTNDLIILLLKHLESLNKDLKNGYSFYSTEYGKGEYNKSTKDLLALYIKVAERRNEILELEKQIKNNNSLIDRSQSAKEIEALGSASKKLKIDIADKEKLISLDEYQISEIRKYLTYLERLSDIKLINEQDYAKKLSSLSKEYGKEIQVQEISREIAMQAIDTMEDAEGEVFKEENFDDKEYNKIKSEELTKDSNLDEIEEEQVDLEELKKKNKF